jgi:hypothetical protein
MRCGASSAVPEAVRFLGPSTRCIIDGGVAVPYSGGASVTRWFADPYGFFRVMMWSPTVGRAASDGYEAIDSCAAAAQLVAAMCARDTIRSSIVAGSTSNSASMPAS